MHKKNTKLRDVSARPTARLQLEDYTTPDATRDEIENWKIDGVIFAEMLRRPDCPKAFRAAFTTIFTEHLLKECVTESPHFIEILFPLVVTHLQSWIPADANRTVEILYTLSKALAPDLYQQIQEQLEGPGLEAHPDE